MLQFNSNQQGQIMLVADKRKGLHASSTIHLAAMKSLRVAGQLPTTASQHTLLVVALVTALRMITKAQAEKMISRNGKLTKPRLQVVVPDASFADAIQRVGQTDAPRLRAGKNFLGILGKQLKRFDIDFVTVSGDDLKPLFGLLSFAQQSIVAPKLLAEIEVSLAPRAASQLA